MTLRAIILIYLYITCCYLAINVLNCLIYEKNKNVKEVYGSNAVEIVFLWIPVLRFFIIFYYIQENIRQSKRKLM